MTMELLNQVLIEHSTKDMDIAAIARLISLMYEADDGNISFSSGNLGINVTCDMIDIVDIFENRSIAKLKLMLC